MGASYEPDIDIVISYHELRVILVIIKETFRHGGKCNLLAVTLYRCYVLLKSL